MLDAGNIISRSLALSARDFMSPSDALTILAEAQAIFELKRDVRELIRQAHETEARLRKADADRTCA